MLLRNFPNRGYGSAHSLIYCVVLMRREGSVSLLQALNSIPHYIDIPLRTSPIEGRTAIPYFSSKKKLLS